MESLSDNDLATKTVEFPQRLAGGATLDDLLVKLLLLFVKRTDEYWECSPMTFKLWEIVIHQEMLLR